MKLFLKNKLNKYFLFSLLMILIVGCNSEKDPCEGVLFGIPISTTGLSDSKCKPICECKNFISKQFTAEDIAELRSWKLTNPFEELTSNPYRQPVPESEPCLCGIVIEDMEEKEYRLETFKDEKEAAEAGAYVTHYDACGLCSTLEDMALYVEDLDIGKAVRECGIKNLATPFRDLLSCLEDLGFSKPCAQIWAYNVRNTQDKCFQVCITDNGKYHNEDGTLTPCLACDEKNSVPVWRATGGRSRRNMGVANNICRFCDEVRPLQHDYPFLQ